MRRTAWCGVLAALCLAIPGLSRAGLALARRADLEGLRPGQIADLFLTGLRLDAMIAGSVVLPVAILLLLTPERWLTGCLKALHLHAGLVFLLLCAAEIGGWFFFAYYDLRPNYLVLEHAGDPEVIATLLSAYPLGRGLLSALAGALLATWLQHRFAGRPRPRGTSAARPPGRAALSDPRRPRHARNARPPPAEPRLRRAHLEPRGQRDRRLGRPERRDRGAAAAERRLPPARVGAAVASRAGGARARPGAAGAALGELARRTRPARSRAGSRRPRARSRCTSCWS